MTLVLHRLTVCLAVFLLAAVPVVQAAVTGELLADESIENAEPSALKAEADLLARIKDGVLLSLARCEMTDTCEPPVELREVERLLEKIDIRITTLSGRYTETSDERLEEALLTYADAREGYIEARDKLDALIDTDEDEFEADPDLYEDAGDEL